MTKPLLKSAFAFWPDPEQRTLMREWCDDIPCVWQPGMLLDNAAEMNAIEIEASIRNAVWQRLWWTGNQDPRMQYPDSPIDLLRFQEAHQSDNSGWGPSWACGPISVAYVGLLAAFDIPARRVWASRGTDGQEDYGAEFWTGIGWSLVVPHLNLHFEAGGRRAGGYVFSICEVRKAPATPVAISGQGEPFRRGDPVNLNRWKGMSARMAIMRGNMPHAQTGALKPEHWQHMEVMEKSGKAKDMPLLVRSGTFDPRSLTDAPQMQQTRLKQ